MRKGVKSTITNAYLKTSLISHIDFYKITGTIMAPTSSPENPKTTHRRTKSVSGGRKTRRRYN